MSVQWAQLRADRLLVATDERAWLQRTELGSPGFYGAMPRVVRATLASTRNLLDGAFAAAEREVLPATAWPMTAEHWAWALVGQWYVAHHSVALLPDVTRRYEELRRDDLVGFVRQKLIEEDGHDRFALADLRALGYDADRLVNALPPPPQAEGLVQLAREFVRGRHPVEFLGYAYALERDAIRVTDDWLRALAEVLPRGVDAASGIRLHAAELDGEHVTSAIAFITALPAADRTRVALACYRTTAVRYSATAALRLSDTQLADTLSRFAMNSTTQGAPQ